jgi:hypothetical protein
MLKIDEKGKLEIVNYTWELYYKDKKNELYFAFNNRHFKKLIDKIDELTYGHKYIFLLYRENYGHDPFITKSANNLQHYIQNAPGWGSSGNYNIICFETWEEAYNAAIILQQEKQ